MSNTLEAKFHAACLTWGAGTLLLSSLSRSLALMMAKGSHVFLVVRALIEPSTCQDGMCQFCLMPARLDQVSSLPQQLTRLSSQPRPASFRALVTTGHMSRRYFSAEKVSKVS